MRHVRFAELVATPWKNGGGRTIELARSGNSLHDFDWRISVATIDRDGPFSRFDGIDRSLARVAGSGVLLTMNGGTLPLDDRIVTFAGELPVHARLTEGPTTDLNVMTRRGRWQHRLERVHAQGQLALEGDVSLIFSLGAEAILDGRSLALHDALLLDRPGIYTAIEADLLVATLSSR